MTEPFDTAALRQDADWLGDLKLMGGSASAFPRLISSLRDDLLAAADHIERLEASNATLTKAWYAARDERNALADALNDATMALGDAP